jgi:hypothetical protein
MRAARTQLRSTGRRGHTSLRGLVRISWCTLVLAALATLALLVAPAHAAPDGLRTTEVSFVGSGGVCCQEPSWHRQHPHGAGRAW